MPFRLIVISPPDNVINEQQLLPQLFEEGLEVFHLRKPYFDREAVEEYLNKLPEKYYSRIVIHQHYELAGKYALKGVHLPEQVRTDAEVMSSIHRLRTKIISSSFHRFIHLLQSRRRYEYVLYSPVFDSISKSGYKSRTSLSDCSFFLSLLAQWKTPYKVIALGGIHAGNVRQVRDAGFDGAAVIGTVWESNDPVDAYRKLKRACL